MPLNQRQPGACVVRFCLLGLILFESGESFAHDQRVDEEMIVSERSDQMIGISTNATEGIVGAKQLEARPLLRPGETLETVPGVIVTQHSGSGKANQYFLRGFNLDHGTDFATWVEGMPVNMPTHAHGQGYSDLNFMIPELVQGIAYKKGPYYADEGDFSAAGAAHIRYFDRLSGPLANVTVGSDDYYRAVLAGSVPLAGGALLGALEGSHDNGPWTNPENYGKFNGVLRYTQGDRQNGFDVSAMAYRGDWNSTDQIPQRAVDAGVIPRFGALDPSDGGESHRYSVSGNWRRADAEASTDVSAYFIDYQLDLFSNFTFLLDNPVQGDQFEQADRRHIYGGQAHQDRYGHLFGFETENTFGIQLRHDDIDQVALFHTERRQRFATTRDDSVQQLSVSPYVENRMQWLPKFRTVAGVRGDFFHFNVKSDDPRNSGTTSDGVASPKLSFIFGPWANTEYYVSLGYGFHSNDARGSTIAIDPNDHVTPADPVNALVEARGTEVGVRTSYFPGLQSTLSLFLLDIDSELLFVGDAGSTEASRPSRRYGLEWTNFYTPFSWLTFDADFSFANARFKNNDPVGKEIPGAIETVIAAGMSIDDINGYFGSIRLRYFGPRPLIEDNSQRSDSTTLVNADVGYKLDKHWRVTLGIFNLFDSDNHDIDYFYPSRISASEPPEGVNDIHFHPVLPRQVRFTVSARF